MATKDRGAFKAADAAAARDVGRGSPRSPALTRLARLLREEHGGYEGGEKPIGRFRRPSAPAVLARHLRDERTGSDGGEEPVRPPTLSRR